MKFRIGVLVVLVTILSFSGNAMASGFAIAEQSVSGLGNAFAGGSAAAEDASTVWHNPAGMTQIEGKQFVGSLHIIIPKAEFKNNGSNTVFAAPLSGGNGGDAGGVVPVPNLYYTETFDTGWSFGLGVNAPFGFATEYDSDWVGRYHGVKSAVETININPSAAHRLNDKFSYGFGISIQYLDAELTNAIDFGALETLGFFAPAVFGMTPQGDDGFTAAEGDSWGFGYNLGFLYNITEKQRVGLSYRSKIEHDVEGDVDWTLPSTGGFDLTMAALNQFQDGGVKVNIELPSTASLSYFGQFNKLALMADISWTEWSVLDELVLDYADGTQNGVTQFQWDDSMRYSIGVSYDLNETSRLRGGLAFDESPIPNDELRGVRVPGEDRTWLTVGYSQEFSKTWSFEAAFAHIMTDDPVINKTDPTSVENNTRGFLQGEYDATVNILSAQLNYNF
ncbi:MAG: hypothetical protein C0623_10755 [Desulfuromonas sp.]|nr:MAG: hypothetical protein C0623_10755 [Desulfuromonas sp.]